MFRSFNQTISKTAPPVPKFWGLPRDAKFEFGRGAFPGFSIIQVGGETNCPLIPNYWKMGKNLKIRTYLVVNRQKIDPSKNPLFGRFARGIWQKFLKDQKSNFLHFQASIFRKFVKILLNSDSSTELWGHSQDAKLGGGAGGLAPMFAKQHFPQ